MKLKQKIKIKIKNFQSHKNTELELSEGINVITGISNCGKSAILKAIYKVIENKPQGNAFLSHFMKPKENMEIEIDFPEGTVIRKKGKSFDGYIVNGKKYEALRTNVPDQVKNLINMLPVNIQKQKEQFFLLDKSPGEVGKYFNKVVGLDEMNTILKKSNDDVRRNKTLLKNKKREIQETKEKIKTIAWVKDARDDFNYIKKNQNRKIVIQDRQKELRDLLEKHLNITCQINEIDISGLEECYNIQNMLQEQEQERLSLIKVQSDLKTLTERYQKGVLKQNEYYHIPECESVLKSLVRLFNESVELKDTKRELLGFINKENKIKNKLQKIDIRKRQKDIDDFYKEVEICPLCGNKL